MAGREATVESGTKVSASGYANRKAWKNFEDLTLHNNFRTENSYSRIFQFGYETGFYTGEMNYVRTKEGRELNFVNCKILANRLNVAYGHAGDLN
jgi:DNA-directed RNA polymerase beta' subunit